MKKLINTGIILITAVILAIQPQISLALNFNTFYSENDVLFYDPEDEEIFEVNCITGAAPVTELIGKDNREKIWNYFMTKGLTKEQTAGVLGNLQAESGFNPGRQESEKTWPNGGYGIAQFTGDNRTAIVNYIKDKLGNDFLNNYYHSSYGGPVTESSGFVPGGMPIEANDKLLLTQLNFLVDRAKSGTIYRSTAETIRDKGWLDKDTARGDKQWDALKKQKTIRHAATLWLYELERPASILTKEVASEDKWGATDETAMATINKRAEFGEAIYNLLKDSAGVSIADDCVPGEIDPNKLSAAKKIMDLVAAGKIILRDEPRTTIKNIVDGKSDGNSLGSGANIYVLNALIAIASAHEVVTVSSINRWPNCFTPSANDTSRHSCGNGSGLDIHTINGVYYGGEAEPWNSTQIAITKSALSSASNVFKESYEMGKKHFRKSWVGQLDKCDPTATYIPDSIKTFVNSGDDTCHHLHMDFTPLIDPNLKCSLKPGRSDCW